MVKKYFSISIAKHGENRVVKDRKKWSKIGGSSVFRPSIFSEIFFSGKRKKNIQFSGKKTEKTEKRKKWKTEHFNHIQDFISLK